MCFRWCTYVYTFAFAAIIWAELACSLVATSTTAFLNEHAHYSAYFIFGANVAFSLWMMYYTIAHAKSATLNWVCGMVSVVTMVFFMVLYATNPLKNFIPAQVAFIVYILIFMILGMVATCYVIFLRLGLEDSNMTSRPKPRRTDKTEDKSSDQDQAVDKTLDQSLNQVLTHVENNPTEKGYVMYAVGSETPFVVRA